MRFVLAICILFTSLIAQGQSSPKAEIRTAISNGDVSVLSEYIGREITLSFHNDENILSKAAAVSRLKKFFSNNEAVSFEVRHKGGSAENKSSYMVGRLKTSDNSFRVFVYLEKNKSEALKIREIRFEKPL